MNATIALSILAGVLLAWGIFLMWRWKQTREFAKDVLTARQDEGVLPASVPQDEFVRRYTIAEGPRAATYIFSCAAFISLLLAPFMAVINIIWNFLWHATGAPPVFQTGTMIHVFLMFVAIMAFMIGVLALAMRRYYTKAPPNLKQVMRDLGANS